MTATEVDLRQVRITGGPLKEAQDLNRAYLLELEPDRLLSRFRSEAGLEPRAVSYPDWESRGVAGHTLGHYLSACAMMASNPAEREFAARAGYLITELRSCQLAHGDGYLAAIPGGREIFAELKAGRISSQGFDLNGGWVPFYTLHKLFAGLRDSYRWLAAPTALTIATDLGNWLRDVLAGLSEDQLQQVLRCEFGGMGEVLADLSVDAADPAFLALSERFHHHAVLDPLQAGRDELAGLHANTQVPKIIAAARQYELTGHQKYADIATYFWETVVHRHSYAIGGNSLHEHFGEPGRLSHRLGDATCETCNTHNMLRLTRRLFGWDQRAGYADYHERAMYNHILGSQRRTDGAVCYFVSLEMGGRKEFRPQYDQFSCCIGSGMENHACYGAGFYYRDGDTVFVNQYGPSRLELTELGLSLEQATRYPAEDTVRLTVGLSTDRRLALKFRHPGWAVDAMTLRVNDEPVISSAAPASFVTIDRRWRDGDEIELAMPMSLRTEPMPDDPRRIALAYGPLILAGDLGAVADDATGQPEPHPDQTPRPVPVLVTDSDRLTDAITADPQQPGVFRTTGLGVPDDVELRPFHQVDDRRYSVYWDVFTPAQWQQAQVGYRAEQARNAEIEAAMLDFLQPGEMQAERDHQFAGEASRVGEVAGRKFRETWLSGWFAFDLGVRPDEPVDLIIQYCDLSEPVNRYAITVDDQPLGHGTADAGDAGRFHRVRHRLPQAWTAGKDRVRVRFTAQPDCKVDKVFGLWTVSSS